MRRIEKGGYIQTFASSSFNFSSFSSFGGLCSFEGFSIGGGEGSSFFVSGFSGEGEGEGEGGGEGGGRSGAWIW